MEPQSTLLSKQDLLRYMIGKMLNGLQNGLSWHVVLPFAVCINYFENMQPALAIVMHWSEEPALTGEEYNLRSYGPVLYDVDNNNQFMLIIRLAELIAHGIFGDKLVATHFRVVSLDDFIASITGESKEHRDARECVADTLACGVAELKWLYRPA